MAALLATVGALMKTGQLQRSYRSDAAQFLHTYFEYSIVMTMLTFEIECNALNESVISLIYTFCTT